jgi:iron complex outermembrane recepter protein
MAAFNRTYRCGASLFAVALAACAAPAFAQSSADTADAPEEADIVVTGVFGATAIEDAPISISAVTAEELAQQNPISAADALKNVPGVFVNSSLGEIRNVVFSRGVSANSLDGDSGYFYVSMQEDGLPVEPATVSNYGPDYFLRPDVMLNRVEGLRGGTATVTGTNAPGGIFNYISRTGKSHPGIEFSGKYGLEGDGKNPYYRVDAYAGGELADGLYYAIGGFYRKSDGARNPGYALNKGGQLRGNLLWESGPAKIKLDVKYLNDHNGWFEFSPARNFSDPRIVAPFTTYDSVLPPANPHTFTNADGSTGKWDGSDLVHSRSLSAGLSAELELSSRLTLSNKMRYTNNKSDWSTGAVIFAIPITDNIFIGNLPFAQILTGTFGIPGTTTYRFHGTSNVAAQIFSAFGVDQTVTVNNLPNQNILTNGILTQAALSQTYRAKTMQDELKFNLDLDSHQLALGAYVAHTRLSQRGGAAGFGLSPIEPQPNTFDITHTLPDGTVLQVTDPAGFAAQGGGAFDNDGYDGNQSQLSFFAGDVWKVSDALSVDLGGRFERISYTVRNITATGGAAYGTNGGGADGNPLTLWDNNRTTYGAPTRTKRTFEVWNYTGAVNYKVSDSFQAYLRYTKGRKAPDMGLIQGIDTPFEIANIFPKAQTIEQIEVGLKYHSGRIRLAAFPFYSKLSNVSSQQILSSSTGTLYTPPPVFGQIKTYGVEFEGDVELAEWATFRTAITVQNPKASGFGVWIQDATLTPGLETLDPTPKGDADNNPKLMTRSTLTLKPSDAAQVFLTHSYLGKRAANRENAFYLPGYHTFDLGASYEFGETFKLQVNVNNVFNQYGVMSWARSGGFLTSLDRQGLTKAAVAANPNDLLFVVPIQPRSFWVTGTVKF